VVNGALRVIRKHGNLLSLADITLISHDYQLKIVNKGMPDIASAVSTQNEDMRTFKRCVGNGYWCLAEKIQGEQSFSTAMDCAGGMTIMKERHLLPEFPIHCNEAGGLIPNLV
jgi:hypothetical protein